MTLALARSLMRLSSSCDSAVSCSKKKLNSSRFRMPLLSASKSSNF
jgi:hypothetical protein